MTESASTRELRFTLNDRPQAWAVEPRTTLLRALRERGVTSGRPWSA